MQDILIRAGCFAAIILLGYVLRNAGFSSETAFPVLSKIVLKITLDGDAGLSSAVNSISILIRIVLIVTILIVAA